MVSVCSTRTPCFRKKPTQLGLELEGTVIYSFQFGSGIGRVNIEIIGNRDGNGKKERKSLKLNIKVTDMYI